ncbi:MAG: biopolymer transporter ExbD [Bdellovibrionota bacterium]
MRVHRSRKSEATFDLNLAPFLDIIVVIIPMLLLSVAFVQVRMIETNVPQIVAQKIQEQKDNKQPDISFALKADMKKGYVLSVQEKGKTKDVNIMLKDGKLDFDGLTLAAVQLKKQHTAIFSLDFMPDSALPYENIVKTMDAIRRLPASEGKVMVKDDKTGELSQTDLMFPDVTFANVIEQ